LVVAKSEYLRTRSLRGGEIRVKVSILLLILLVFNSFGAISLMDGRRHQSLNLKGRGSLGWNHQLSMRSVNGSGEGLGVSFIKGGGGGSLVTHHQCAILGI